METRKISGCLGMKKFGNVENDYTQIWLSYWSNENILKLIMVKAVQLYECTKNHWIVQFQWVNFSVCILYVSKAVFKKN